MNELKLEKSWTGAGWVRITEFVNHNTIQKIKIEPKEDSNTKFRGKFRIASEKDDFTTELVDIDSPLKLGDFIMLENSVKSGMFKLSSDENGFIYFKPEPTIVTIVPAPIELVITIYYN